MKNKYCGTVLETDHGYVFKYDSEYLKSENAEAVSLTLPLSEKPYQSKTLFAFFDGLIPEGWLLNLAEKNWKVLDPDLNAF